MKKKTRTIRYHLVVRNILILFLVLSAGCVVFFLAAEKIYMRNIEESVLEAYHRLEAADLPADAKVAEKEEPDEIESDITAEQNKMNGNQQAEVQEENRSLISSIEEEGLNVEIFRADGEAIYITYRRDSTTKGLRDADCYQTDPEVEITKKNNGKRFRIRGIVEQNGITYYIKIFTTATGVRSSFTYATLLFIVLMGVYAIIVGTLFARSSRKITNALKNIQTIAERIVNKDFSDKLEEDQEFLELAQLSTQINNMSDHIQENIQALEKYNRLLEADQIRKAEIERMRKQFISNISHEMKTPLFIVSSRLEMMECITDPEKKEEYRQSILHEIFQMNELLESMLRAYDDADERTQQIIEETDVSKVARCAMTRYEALFSRKKITVKRNLAEDSVIWVDAQELKMAMNNFLSNAFRNTPAEGNVQINVEKLRDGIRFAVYNDGSSIEEEEQHKIWKQFYKGNGKENESGTGLGLYLVKTFVESMNGSYGVRNIANGIEFWFELPIGEQMKTEEKR